MKTLRRDPTRFHEKKMIEIFLLFFNSMILSLVVLAHIPRETNIVHRPITGVCSDTDIGQSIDLL